MLYRDPRCVHVANSLAEAELVAVFLEDRGIATEVMNPMTLGGLDGLTVWSRTGVSSRGIEVWVKDPIQAGPALQALEEHAGERAARQAEIAQAGPVTVECEECGTDIEFP